MKKIKNKKDKLFFQLSAIPEVSCALFPETPGAAPARKGQLVLWIVCICLIQSLFSAFDFPTNRWVDPAGKDERLSVYFSGGDNEIIYCSPAIDSPAVITELLENMIKVYGIKRVYWRTPEIIRTIDYSVNSPDNFHYVEMLNWTAHCYKKLGTQNSAAFTKKLGLEAWGFTPLFNHGAQPDIDASKALGPHFTEGIIRINNPDWVPQDKYSLRKHPGPVSFVRPEARKELIKMYLSIAKNLGLDGMMFHSYIENFGMHFDDEFNYDPLLIQAFKKRFGADIIHEPYDVEALADLQGEYLTEFFRELRKEFNKAGIKLSLILQADKPDEPQRWLAADGVKISGRIRFDWKTYVSEKLFDEFFIYNQGRASVPGTAQEIWNQVRAQGMFVDRLGSASSYQTHPELPGRTIAGGYEELECGYREIQDAGALNSDDPSARLAVLWQMAAGKTPPDWEGIIKSVRDPRILVRRRALRTIHQLGLKDRAAVPENAFKAAEQALNDNENAVRVMAMTALAGAGGSKYTDSIFTAVGKYANQMWYVLPPSELTRWGDERTSDLLKGLLHKNDNVRYFTLQAVRQMRYKAELLPALIDSSKHRSARIRWMTAWAMAAYARTPEGFQSYMKLLDDPHPTVRAMAAFKVSTAYPAGSRLLGAEQTLIFQKLSALFETYGNPKTGDLLWGYVPIGEGVFRMGPRGEDYLREKLTGQNKLLAERAWQILYQPQNGWKHVLLTREAAEEGYLQHPKVRRLKNLPPLTNTQAAGNSQFIPYICLAETNTLSINKNGSGGSHMQPTGLWRGLDDGSGLTGYTNKFTDDPAGGAGKTLLLIRDGTGSSNGVQAIRTDYRMNRGKFSFSFHSYLDSPISSAGITICSSARVSGTLTFLFVNGKLIVAHTAPDATKRTIVIPQKKWILVEADGDISDGFFNVHVTIDGVKTLVADKAPLTGSEEFNCIWFSPQSPNGNRVYIKNIGYQVEQPRVQ